MWKSMYETKLRRSAVTASKSQLRRDRVSTKLLSLFFLHVRYGVGVEE